jgi:selenocysteine lyase/cysteine desulfurase
MMKRRVFLGLAAAAAVPGRLIAAPTSRTQAARVPESGSSNDRLNDDGFWARLRSEYDPPYDYADLDQANTAPTPRRVFDAYVERARYLSRAPAERFGTMWNDELDAVARPALARYLGAAPDQVAFTANATAALNTVLHGFPLARGDEILITDHEYPDMVETVLGRARRDGVVPRIVRAPLAGEDERSFLARVADAITPRTRLLLISHVSAWSGTVLPVADVCALARARGVAVLVDAAQSVGILDVSFNALGCDFLAASLHKGLGAPLPTGVLLIRAEHLGKVEPLHPPSWDTSKHPLDLYEWSGTFNIAGLATIKEALEFQAMIGAERKRARLMRLGARWQDALSGVDGVQLLTPRQPGQFCGPAAFAIERVASGPLASHLRKKHRVLVQDKAGRHSPFRNAIRVSPGAHSTFAEIDRLVESVKLVAQAGQLPAQ